MSESNNGSSMSRLSRKASERSKVVFQQEDPLSQISEMPDSMPEVKVKKENLTIRQEDEVRIVTGMSSAAKKQTTGSIYSVVVDISKSGTLGIGVKDLSESILAVSMLKRENGVPGPGEEAGIRLGDIIFGINFVPTREGSRTLINVIKRETQKKKKILHVQAWRCHQLCSDNIPGYVFPRADEVIVQAYFLFRTKVFSDWERWNFIEILLGHMIEDLKQRTFQSSVPTDTDGKAAVTPVKTKVKQMQVLDLERNILQAKGLRTALCVRIVHTKMMNDTVIYVLRVEDVESGLQWVVHRRFRDFFSLNDELLDMSHFAKDIDFPKRRIALKNSTRLVEMRIGALEQYVRKMLHLLTLYATMDSAASRSLRHLQNFLGVDRYVDCVHPPLVDDQRYIELMAYRFLNDFSSPACQQCVRFITTIDLDGVVEGGPEGYRSVLSLVKDALAEVEQFVEQQHQQQMIQALRDRRPDMDNEHLRSFVRKCVRRQVEAALFLPLRRNVFRIVYSFVAQKSKHMQRSMTLLQQATANYLMVDAHVQHAKALPVAVKAFRKVIQAYLPADQGQLLIEAAGAVTELHRECHEEKLRLKALGIANPADTVPEGGQGDAAERISGARQSIKSAHRPSAGGQTPTSAKRQESTASVRSPTSATTEDKLFEEGESFINNRRNSLSNRFFRQTSTSTSISTSNSIDLISKQTLADPVGSMFQSDLTPEPTLASVDEGDYESNRLSFSDANAPNTVGGMLSIGAPSVEQVSFNERSQHNLDIINTAIFDTVASEAQASADGTPFNVLMSSKGSVGIDANSTDHGIFSLGNHAPVRRESLTSGVNNISLDDERQVKRPQSVRMKSLLDDILDGKGGDSDEEEEEQATQELPRRNSLKSGQTEAPSSSSLFADEGSVAPTAPGLEPRRSEAEVKAEKDRLTLEKDVANIQDLIQSIAVPASPSTDDMLIVSSTAEHAQHDVISADDFLPLFTYVLVQAGLPQLLLVKEVMLTLVDDEDTYGETGYYLATLEAATQHICDLADQFEKVANIDSAFGDEEDVFDYFDKKT